MTDAGPPLVLMAFGLILWLAVNATLAGISIQTIRIILFLVGVVWLLIELVQSRTVARRHRDVVVRHEPVVRERESTEVADAQRPRSGGPPTGGPRSSTLRGEPLQIGDRLAHDARHVHLRDPKPRSDLRLRDLGVVGIVRGVP